MGIHFQLQSCLITFSVLMNEWVCIYTHVVLESSHCDHIISIEATSIYLYAHICFYGSSSPSLWCWFGIYIWIYGHIGLRLDLWFINISLRCIHIDDYTWSWLNADSFVGCLFSLHVWIHKCCRWDSCASRFITYEMGSMCICEMIWICCRKLFLKWFPNHERKYCYLNLLMPLTLWCFSFKC